MCRLFQLLHIVQDSGRHHLVEVLILVDAVEKTKVNVVGAELFHLPGEGLLDGVQITGPAVLAPVVVDSAEMELKHHLLPLPGDGPAKGSVDVGSPAAQVEIIDSAADSGAHHLFDLLIRALLDTAHTDAQHTDLLCSVGQFPVFHNHALLMIESVTDIVSR